MEIVSGIKSTGGIQNSLVIQLRKQIYILKISEIPKEFDPPNPDIQAPSDRACRIIAAFRITLQK